MRSARLPEMVIAMSIGVVSHAMPSLIKPSDVAIEIGTRGCAILGSGKFTLSERARFFLVSIAIDDQHHTCVDFVGLLLELLEQGDAMGCRLRRGRDLSKGENAIIFTDVNVGAVRMTTVYGCDLASGG